MFIKIVLFILLLLFSDERYQPKAHIPNAGYERSNMRPKLQVLHLLRTISSHANGMAQYESGRHEFPRDALSLFEERSQDVRE